MSAARSGLRGGESCGRSERTADVIQLLLTQITCAFLLALVGTEWYDKGKDTP
jgi:hypothetical protein